MQKRAFFRNRWLGVALVVPQLLLIFTFFYWPTGQALFWAFTLQRPWGGGNEWVGFANFRDMLSDPIYWNSVLRSLVFALISTALAMGIAFVLAVLTDRELRGHKIYRSVLIWHRRTGAGAGFPLHAGAGGGVPGLPQQALARLVEPDLERHRCHDRHHHRLRLEIRRL